MQKVSILMNCYNGERYLKEAIDSVYRQSFKDWKIIFIDNCSTDRSEEIAKSYDEKLEYHRIEKNIPFGAARNYGLHKCSGEYVSFLDVDDIYYDDTLQVLVDEIEDTGFLLVYGGRKTIDGKGDTIGCVVPAAKEGDIFRELLLQFDIPTASSIIDLKQLNESELNYDQNILVSAEYCLFLQLSVKNKIKSIQKDIVYYRVHNESLTSKNLPYLYNDRVYTLKKIISENSSIDKKYVREFKEAFARADYYKVKHLMFLNKRKEARAILKKHIFQDIRYFSLNVFLYLPAFIWNYILYKKYSR